MTNRLDTPISKEQAVRAFRRLSPEDSQIIQGGVEKLAAKTGLKFAEALTVFASIGMHLIRHGE